MKEENKTYYIIKIKEKYMIDELFRTENRQYFTGLIVNQTESNFYFELKNTEELLIVPHCYIEWMCPDKTVEHKRSESLCRKEIHAYQNENGTYKVEIIQKISDKDKSEIKSEIECADIHITAHVAKKNDKICSFTVKE